MALDPKYVVAVSQQEVFTDKETGLALASGEIRFFKDLDRVASKDVFVLTGAPDYSYINIGSVVSINAAGSPSYLGNNVNIYYYPYDIDDGIERYYVQVVNSGDTEQFTREGKPNVFSSSQDGDIGNSAFVNYIPNGQFVSRNNIIDSGLIVNATTPIALGAWTFNRPEGSDSTDHVTFSRFASSSSNPEAHPRYSVKVVNSGGGSGDLFKDIRVRFDDVNKFGSEEFTHKFSARSLSGILDDVDLVLIKNYGTGGSAETETSIESFSVGGSFASYLATFNFGNNDDKTIGPDDDDYLELAIRLPSNVVFDAEFTNFDLVKGDFSEVNFPDTTTRQSVSQFLGGSFPIPDPDGMDLGLTVRLGTTGLEYDSSGIGNPFFKFISTLEFGELWADGTSYTTADISSEGIPFLRLQQKYFDSTTRTAIYGTGADNLTAYSPGESGNLATFSLISNESGVATAAADGVATTGFTFNLIYTGVASDNDINAWISDAGNGYMQVSSAGIVADPAAGTSGLSIATNVLVKGTTTTTEEFDVIFDTAVSLQNLGGSGKYWLYDTTPTNYYVWYKVTDETDPAVASRTGIQVNVNVNDDATTLAEKSIFALSNLQSSYIETVAASLMSASDYFEASIPSEDFYVWYTIDGIGTDPDISNKTGIQVDLIGADTAQGVAEKSQTTINSRKFAVPDSRELLFRGAAMGRNEIGLDQDQLYRFSRVNVKFGATQIGSEQLSVNRSHIHDANASIDPVTLSQPSSSIFTSGSGSTFSAGVNPTVTVTIDETGRTESRPPTMYVGVAIKY